MENEEQKFRKRSKDVVDGIIGQTYSRHSQLTEKDFLEKIGFKDFDGGEDKAVNIAIYNSLVELTKQYFKLEGKIKVMTEYLERVFKQNGVIGECKNGK